MAKKYASLSTLSTLVDNIKNLFATKADVDVIASGKANASHTHSISDVTNLQNALDEKQATINGAASTITSSNLVVGKVLVSDNYGKVDTSGITRNELGYLTGVTSSIQVQFNDLNGKINETKQYAADGDTTTLATSKSYTDEAIAQKTQVQIITWGTDD